jgi:hypothetical protein
MVCSNRIYSITARGPLGAYSDLGSYPSPKRRQSLSPARYRVEPKPPLPSNENKMSDGGQARASLGVETCELAILFAASTLASEQSEPIATDSPFDAAATALL